MKPTNSRTFFLSDAPHTVCSSVWGPSNSSEQPPVIVPPAIFNLVVQGFAAMAEAKVIAAAIIIVLHAVECMFELSKW